ncbi:glycosyltransferase family 4 protein [Flavobacteriaceae bacterium F89]|uniref:Glycosyltransferase family 4 protein n=1 Tax=Cerina litoralis TaxID=2874477 RepID=A0AAE3EVT8_9FLAO|nr:glycosyltransferase family 4 protein [Cerina litoralis]MCG2461903.1 glycosyltransferase family 4 protein [Cerina litoralis]
MKIDFISNSISGGGAERVMVLLANEFAQKNNTVSIITFNEGLAYELNQKVNHIQLHGGKLKNHTLRSFVNLFKYYWKKPRRPEVAIAMMPKMNFISIIVCRILRVKIIACEHNNHLRKTEKFERFIWGFSYRFADQLNVLTKFDKPFFEDKGAKVTIMPNPCSFTLLDSENPHKTNTILAVGSLNRIHHKGFDNLIKLIEPVLVEFPDWQLKIVGGGDEGEEVLRQLVEKFEIKSQVIFTGFQNNVAEIMQQSKIFILSSRWEGLPMVLLEAMSQGMACIAYDCKTGPSDIIKNFENGLLIEDQNMEAMQNGLKALIIDEQFRKSIGENALRSLDYYSMDNVLLMWQRLFEKVMTN